MPPGGGTRSAGQNFIADPKALGHSVVKANVKLRFTNKAQTSMVVIRSMELVQKKTTMTFKQLDGVIRTMDSETGERVSLSHKCGELDKQIPSLLGVSKAILDYVLFVHQEDSSWPLQEASVLKKRFDDIFDSTRYSKALESFRKTKKELTSNMKDLKAEVAGLTSHKHAAKIFKKDLDVANTSIETLEEQRSQARKEIQEAEKEQQRLFAIVETVEAINDKIDKKQRAVQRLLSVNQTKRGMLEEDLTKTHDKVELQSKLKDFDMEMIKEQKRKEDLLERAQKLKEEIERLRQEEMKLNSSKGKVAAEKDAQEKRLADRIRMMEKIHSSYTLDIGGSMTNQSVSRLENSFDMSQRSLMTEAGSAGTLGSFPAEDVASFMEALETKESDLRESLKSHKDRTRAQEDECNEALQELVGKNKACENGTANICVIPTFAQLHSILPSLFADYHSGKRKESLTQKTKRSTKKSKSWGQRWGSG
jgi:DNA repair protein RAD50